MGATHRATLRRPPLNRRPSSPPALRGAGVTDALASGMREAPAGIGAGRSESADRNASASERSRPAAQTVAASLSRR